MVMTESVFCLSNQLVLWYLCIDQRPIRCTRYLPCFEACGTHAFIPRNMVTSFIYHERIRTTVPRAKELRKLADNMVTLAKKGNSPLC